MRKHLALAALLCLSAASSVSAQTTTATGTGVGVSESNSGAVAIAKGGNLTINNPENTTATVNSRVSGTQTIKSNPSMAIGLTAAGLETCLGSASGMISLAGFGLGGGSTMTDEGCQARLDARTLASFGLKAAAVARLCQRKDIYASMPDICERYRPVGIAPGGPAPIVLSTDGGGAGIVRVVDGRDGVEKDCLNYNAGAQKCTHWLGEAPRKQRARVANVQPPQRIMVKPKAEKPRLEPKVEPAKVEPVEAEKKS